jgi:hypothetical protein
MAFFSRAGKTSGVCRDCNELKDKQGSCDCRKASCIGCGAEGTVSSKDSDEMGMRKKIGCNCE